MKAAVLCLLYCTALWQQVDERDHVSDHEMSTAPYIYKITPRKDWEAAEAAGSFTGAPIDIADGYIHFSTASQAAETAAKHFAGQDDLLLVAVRQADLGEALKWEISRGDALFPHLYGPLPMNAVEWAKEMPLVDGFHQLPLS